MLVLEASVRNEREGSNPSPGKKEKEKRKKEWAEDFSTTIKDI